MNGPSLKKTVLAPAPACADIARAGVESTRVAVDEMTSRLQLLAAEVTDLRETNLKLSFELDGRDQKILELEGHIRELQGIAGRAAEPLVVVDAEEQTG